MQAAIEIEISRTSLWTPDIVPIIVMLCHINSSPQHPSRFFSLFGDDKSQSVAVNRRHETAGQTGLYWHHLVDKLATD